MSVNSVKKAIYIASGAALAALFAIWCANTSYSVAGYFAAVLSAALFYAVFARFVPVWLDAWRSGDGFAEKPKTESVTAARIFIALIAWDIVIILLAYLGREILDYRESFSQYLGFWTCTDSRHYLDIARDWYLSEGSMDRLVQLVFLPGYPLAVKAANVIFGNYLVSGLIVSALCFAGAGAVFYKLLRLDIPHDAAIRAVKFLSISPAAFFFASPMSESLFLLLCLGCIYLTRRGKLFPACILGALAAFTRSLGIILVVPVLFELISNRAKTKNYLCLAIIPLGFAAYCIINYTVSGDAFKFMEYQSEHWGQHIGLFWSTAAYQTEYMIESAGQKLCNFWGLWLPNILASFASLIIMLLAAKRLRPSYTAYFLAYFVVAIGATWLLSAPRYLAAVFSLPAALAELSENKKANIFITALSILLFVGYFCAFLLRWQVW